MNAPNKLECFCHQEAFLVLYIKMVFLCLNHFITEDSNAIHTIITTIQLKLNEIIIGNYLQQKKKKHQAR